MLDAMPEGKEEEQKALSKLLYAFAAADDARSTREKDWMRWYRAYNAYVEAEDKNEDNWRSKIYIPACFYIVETVAPRLVAQLPAPVVLPVGEDDVEGARSLEEAIKWGAEVTGLYVQIVAAIKDTLNYGTGILKTYADEKTAVEMVSQPIMEDIVVSMPVTDPETQQPLRSPDGNIVMEEQVLGQRQTGTEMVRRPYTYYRGPFGEAVDLFNFWFSPEASSIEDARWVIHKAIVSRKEFEKLVAKGYYRMPEDLSAGDFYASIDDPKFKRYASIGLGGDTRPIDAEFDAVELLEFWTDESRACVANRRAIVAAGPNPFNHQEKPFIRLVDHFKAHEPYGIGEIQMLEGRQDEINALVNSRIDAVKLAMNLMFFVDEDALVDTSDLRIRPGGRIRIRNRYGLPMDQIIKRLDFGDVNNSAYVEVDEAMKSIERISGVAGPPGPEDSQRFRTATGVMSIDEGMASRFAHKLKMMELTGLQRLFQHFGVLLQQFVDKPMSRRIWSKGEWDFVSVDPGSIQGRFDYQVQAESSAITESNRRQQAAMLYDRLAVDPYINPMVPREEFLRSHGIKDTTKWLIPKEQQLQQLLGEVPPEMVQQIVAQMGQVQQQEQGAPVGGP